MAKLFDFEDYILPAKLIPRFLHPGQHLFDKPPEIDGRGTGTQCGHGVLIPGRQIYESNFDKRLWRPMDHHGGRPRNGNSGKFTAKLCVWRIVRTEYFYGQTA